MYVSSDRKMKRGHSYNPAREHRRCTTTGDGYVCMLDEKQGKGEFPPRLGIFKRDRKFRTTHFLKKIEF